MKPHQFKIIKGRYLQKNEQSWEDLCERVHTAVMAEDVATYDAAIDPIEKGRLKNIIEASKKLLLERKFLFNTPTWINAGMEGDRTLSACFVGELHDTMLGKGGILEASRWFGAVQKFGGGTGIDLSDIRAKGSHISSTHGKACGPIAVLKYLAATSQMITQGGVRDGANMATMSVYHPDVMEFIKLKSRESKFMLEIPREYANMKLEKGDWTKEEAEEYIDYCKKNGLYQLFNVSIMVDEAFMKAISQWFCDKRLKLTEYAGKEDTPYFKKLPCGEDILTVWFAIINQAWASGDPGILFFERAKEYAKLHSPFLPVATNPCGEQFLPEHGSCNLGSIDLSKFVKDPGMVVLQNDSPTPSNYIDWDKLEAAIHLSVRMLDNVVSLNKHPVKEIADLNLKERRIGLGVMGLADVFFKIGIPYDSEAALDLSEAFASFFARASWTASNELALEKGPFPAWTEVLSPTIDYSIVNKDYRIPSNRRNATMTTVAPTGTISLVAGCSSGIEPHFALVFEHNGLEAQGGLGTIWASDTVEEVWNLSHNANGHTPEIFEEDARKILGWKPANEIPVEYHVKHQAIWQRWIDNSISKTINLPNSATVDDVENIYMMAWELGCKGSTIFRDGCKPFQVLNAPQKPANEPTEALNPGLQEVNIETSENGYRVGQRYNGKRPEITPGVTIKIRTNDGSLYVTINRGIRDEPFELFATVGKAGGKAHAYTEALGRLISLALQHNIPVDEIIKELKGISAGDPVGFGPNRVLSVPDGIGIALEKFVEYENGVTGIDKYDTWVEVKDGAKAESLVDVCPQCKANLVRADGCSGGLCLSCGFSKCG